MLVPSSLRPIPLVRRSDLQVCATSFCGKEHIVVKDPVGIRYFLLPVLQYQVLNSLDGHRSLSEILAHVQQGGMSSGIGPAEVLRLITDLASKRLIWSRRTGTSSTVLVQAIEEESRNVWAVILNPLFIRLPGFHPGSLLKAMSHYLGWIYSPAVASATLLFVCITWLFLLLHVDAFFHELPAVSGLLTGQGLWTLWIVVGTLKVLHELSHGMACERFGAECQSTGIAFLFFSPCMYCDVTDAWMLERKSHRLAISMAGVYVELFISSLGLWLWWFSAPGLFHQVCLQVFLAGSIATLLFNANPLLRFDGYYVLADLLEFPNLYSKSRQSIKRLAARFLLGIRLPDDTSVSSSESSLILITYGVASLGYQLLMLMGLGLFLYGMLEPIGMAAIALLVILVFVMATASRFLKWSLRMVRIQKSPARAVLQSLVTAAGCTAALLGVWFCPLGNSMTAPVVLEPRAVQPVYVETAGTVRSIHARDGDVVQQGTLLLELENLELDRQLAAMEGVLATHETDFRLAQATGNPDLMVLAKTAIESCTDQISLIRTELERLQLRANVSGTLLSTNGLRIRARMTPDEPSEESAGILNSRLIGMPLQRKDRLCEIAPTSKWQATLWIDQRSRQFLSPGHHVNVCLDAFPGAIMTGTISAIGVANEPEIPAVLSIKFGGQFASKTTDGGESPAEPVYQATVLLDEVNLPVQRGMKGTGRFTRSPRTIGSWLTDEFHQLFVAR